VTSAAGSVQIAASPREECWETYCFTSGHPAPAVVVFARNVVAVAGDTAGAMVRVTAVLARLITGPFVTESSAARRYGRGGCRCCCSRRSPSPLGAGDAPPWRE
jgi:hypothetical protein